MTQYRIVCTRQEPAGHPHNAAHIVSVGVGANPHKASQSLTLTEVLNMMNSGHAFYTQSELSGVIAQVNRFDCSCGRTTIRSTPDAVTDNNLDNLRRCGDFNG